MNPNEASLNSRETDSRSHSNGRMEVHQTAADALRAESFDSSSLPRKAVAGWENRSSSTPVANPLASIKITDENGAEIKPKGKLGAGDYSVKLGDGRDFAMHVPEKSNGATMYVFQGSMEPKWKQEDFAKQTQMNKEADKTGVTTVYIHPALHFLAEYSKEKAWAYNAPNSLIEARNTSQAGYNDNKYVENVKALLPKIANVNPSADTTAAIAFSQGGPFLRQFLTLHSNFAETVGFVGTAFPKGELPPMVKGNAKYVLEVNLLADKTILPKSGHESLQYKAQKAEHAIVASTGIGKSYGDQADPLSPIRNDLIQDSGPVLKEALAPDYSTKTSQFGKSQGDTITTMRDHNGHQLDVIDLPNAFHAYPSDNPEKLQTSSAPCYDAPISPLFMGRFEEILHSHQ